MTDHDTNYDKVLDMIEHPERYSREQLQEMLSDPYVREIYDLISMTDSSVEASEMKTDVDAEWEAFACSHPVRGSRIFPWIGTRAASIAAIIGVSIVAVAAGIAVTVAVFDHKSTSTSENDVEIDLASVDAKPHDMTAMSDSVRISAAPILFEDQSLESIMGTISEIYGLKVRFNNKGTARLHLYYRLNPALTIDEVVAQLNTFEQININLSGNQLTID